MQRRLYCKTALCALQAKAERELYKRDGQAQHGVEPKPAEHLRAAAICKTGPSAKFLDDIQLRFTVCPFVEAAVAYGMHLEAQAVFPCKRLDELQKLQHMRGHGVHIHRHGKHQGVCLRQFPPEKGGVPRPPCN